MGDKTGITWTDASWNPSTGCDRVSDGCDHCYALTLAKRLKGMGAANYQRDGDPVTSGPGFGLTMHPHMLDKPIRWTKPRMIFVNSMSDLFHKDVTDAFIAEVFAVMALTPRHTYQVLTKRHGRMRSLLSSDAFHEAVVTAMFARWKPDNRLRDSLDPAWRWDVTGTRVAVWPLPNVWLGVSAEDQKHADLRIPALLDTPAAVRFVSAEPLLGPIDLTRISRASWNPRRDATQPVHDRDSGALLSPALDWVIVGGESGPGHRTMDLAWVRTMQDQCDRAGVAFFMKQMGESLARDMGLAHKKGADPGEWPERFAQDFPVAG